MTNLFRNIISCLGVFLMLPLSYAWKVNVKVALAGIAGTATVCATGVWLVCLISAVSNIITIGLSGINNGEGGHDVEAAIGAGNALFHYNMTTHERITGEHPIVQGLDKWYTIDQADNLRSDSYLRPDKSLAVVHVGDNNTVGATVEAATTVWGVFCSHLWPNLRTSLSNKDINSMASTVANSFNGLEGKVCATFDSQTGDVAYAAVYVEGKSYYNGVDPGGNCCSGN